MAKAKARRRVRDTWKEKSWYTIKTPVNFEDKEIGETPARDPELLIGRGVEVTMRELTGDFSKQYIKLRFEIDNVAGDVANTKFTGHKTTTDYVRSIISNAQRLRNENQIKVKQPLKTMFINGNNEVARAVELYRDIIESELNIKNVIMEQDNSKFNTEFLNLDFRKVINLFRHS